MKVSLNWVKEYIDVKLPVDQLVQKIGAQLGAVEEVIDLGKKYQGIVIAKVVSCEKHPNADKLKVCLIDDGKVAKNVKRDRRGLVEVVCGAPNVRENMLVAWLPPGTTVPATFDKDLLVLEARDIRGVVSNGMLASAHELAISDDHTGILELHANSQLPTANGSLKPGDDFAKAFGLNDHIIDIENSMFTHRPDLFGQLGVAREIAGIGQQPFHSPDWYVKGNGFEGGFDEAAAGLSVKVEIPELCSRYTAVIVSGVQVRPSPLWLQTYLSRVGIRPINNIVDMTNYMMMLTSQPLHAFDFDKVAQNDKADIIVRKPHKGEKITLLGGKTIEPRADAILICAPDRPIALGGVMGGNDSEVDHNTTRIIIECANFDMYNIRKTAMEHGIFTDSVTRFTKGQSPAQCPPVLYKSVQVTQEVSPGSKPIGKTVDSNYANTPTQIVKVGVDFINERLGLSLSVKKISELLENVEFKVLQIKGKQLGVTPPFWRTDIEIPEDVVEEVGRLHGYDYLPLELPRRDLTPAKKDQLLELKNRIRQTLSAAGANELITYSFVHGNLLEKVGQDKQQAFQIANALSPDLQYYRMSLTPSLLDKVHANIKAGNDEFAIFEIGKAHVKGEPDMQEPSVPKEVNGLACVFAADSKVAVQKFVGASFYQARKYLINLLAEFGVTRHVTPESLLEADLYKNPWLEQMTAPYEPTRSAVLRDNNGLVWGVVGEFKSSIRNALKLPEFSAGFEIDPLLCLQSEGNKYVPLPRFPSVQQDMSLRVPADLTYQQLFDFIREELAKIQPDNTLPSLGPVDIYQRENDTSHKQITLRLSIASYERTMTDQEVNALLDKVALAAKEKFGAERL